MTDIADATGVILLAMVLGALGGAIVASAFWLLIGTER